ncbi:MAG: hypothetical protein H7Y33_18350 [Cytophagales bacterium]|nr:hypothetical protein [Rhizobacter sp.]
MRTQNFASWLGQMLLGFALFLSGLEVARLMWGTWWELAVTGAVAGGLGLALMARAEHHERPQRVLRKARRALNFPTQWAVKFDKSVPQGGVIPVAVIRSDGVRFVIDIQGFTDAGWNDPIEGESLLVGPRGKKFKTDPVAPLIQAAAAWSATPVLWLPEAKHPRNLRQEGCDLIVVLGGARDLKHVLRGAEIVPRRDASLEMTMPPKPARKPRKAPAVGTPELV